MYQSRLNQFKGSLIKTGAFLFLMIAPLIVMEDVMATNRKTNLAVQAFLQ